MRGRFFCFVATSLGATTTAWASFDLLLVADSSQNCIHRYDGDTGVYLGQFGQQYLQGVIATTIDSVTSTLWVATSTGLYEFNYNTGALLTLNQALFNFGEVESTPAGGLIRTFSGASTVGASHIPNPRSSSNATALFSGTETYTAVGVDSTGDAYAVGRTFGTMVRWNQLTNATETALSSTSLVGSRGGDIRANQLLVMSDDGLLDWVNTQTNGISIGNSAGSISAGQDAAWGHNNTAWGLGTNAGGAAVAQLYAQGTNGNGSFNAAGSGLVLSQVTTPKSISVVLAPEPGTWAALSAGALLLRRRRRKPSAS